MAIPHATIEILKKHQHEYHPVVPFNPLKDLLFLLDLTAGNKELTNDILSDIKKFTSYINEKLLNKKALYEKKTNYRYDDETQ